MVVVGMDIIESIAFELRGQFPFNDVRVDNCDSIVLSIKFDGPANWVDVVVVVLDNVDLSVKYCGGIVFGSESLKPFRIFDISDPSFDVKDVVEVLKVMLRGQSRIGRKIYRGRKRRGKKK
jgi:hypothetical protein